MNKTIRYLLLTGLVFTLVISGLDAQDYKLKKWVVGSGGMIAETNSAGVQMSGIVGQLAIEKLSNTTGTEVDVYQGFWVPTDFVSSVDPIDGASELSNYPNPLTNNTTIEFSLPGASYITLNIYDVSGNKIKVLADDLFDGGNHNLIWNALNQAGMEVASGSYMYELVVRPAAVSGYAFKPYTLRNVMVVVK